MVSVHWDGCQSYKLDLDLGQGLVGTAAAERRPVRVGDVRTEPRFVDCGDDQVRSEMALPLLVKGRLIGVLDLESYHKDAFRGADERLLATLADNLAIALENAALYERLKTEEQALAADLRTAREMQRVLLPRRTPWLPGLQTAVAYCPARHLGGDLYDFLSFGDNRTAIAVGDVAGKGTPAALYGSLAIGSLRERASAANAEGCCFAPSRVLAELNTTLHHLGIGNRFLAMAFALYDTEARTMLIANSGLPHPYLVRRDGSVEAVVAEGVPLGLLPDRRYDDLSLALAPGEALIICSDGVEESLGAKGEEFGRDRVEASIGRHWRGGSARSLAQALLDDSASYGAEDDGDDRTIVVLKLTGGAAASGGTEKPPEAAARRDDDR